MTEKSCPWRSGIYHDKIVSTKVTEETFKILSEFCYENNISRSRFINYLIADFFKKLTK